MATDRPLPKATPATRQGGSSLIEMAITLMVFVIIVLGIAEFGLLMMNISRTSEVTRELGRIAIVRAPVCDLSGGCPGAAAALACPGGAAVSLTLGDLALNCGANPNATGCLMLDAAQRFDADILADQIRVTYACSTAGADDRPEPIPLVSVAVEGLTKNLLFPELFGLEDFITVPPFETTRTGEDLYTEHSP